MLLTPFETLPVGREGSHGLLCRSRACHHQPGLLQTFHVFFFRALPCCCRRCATTAIVPRSINLSENTSYASITFVYLVSV